MYDPSAKLLLTKALPHFLAAAVDLAGEGGISSPRPGGPGARGSVRYVTINLRMCRCTH